MNEMSKWIERAFPEKPDPGLFPMIVERLAGTAARLDEKLAGIPDEYLTKRDADLWSIQEHVGHLADLEPLWLKRLEEFEQGAGELTAADMSNRKTEDAGHNNRPAADVARSFRTQRRVILELLEPLDHSSVIRTALHPRLKQPMRLIDLCYFIAEHDDHHLSRISEIWRRISGNPKVF